MRISDWSSDVCSSDLPTSVGGLYINGGWGTGGFKAVPAGGWCLAHVMATGQSHPLASAFGLERFESGAMIDEASASGKIGRASCRERVCQYELFSVVGVSLKKKKRRQILHKEN